MPVDNGLLVEGLRRLAARMRSDLAARATTGPVAGQLREEYESAAARSATASTWTSWLDDRISRTAAAWILATVLIRFCEDNDLLDIRLLGDDASDGQIVDAVERLRTHPALAVVFDATGRSLWQLRPGGEACDDLIVFWRRRTEGGALVHDFTDPARDTAFLADLPAMLDENARRSYGQVPTPEFVVEFVQDLVLEPALDDHGSDAPGLLGFRCVDPACGTGEFLLGAYHRLMRRWSELGPDMSPWQRAARALRSVHGCDIDPCAVLVSRFRLLMAALNSVDEKQRLDDVPDLQIVVAAKDSLLSGRPGVDTFESGIDAYAARHGLLAPGSYHAVTTNPPYVSVKDKALFAAYRDAYESCSGPYALSVPFAELAFRLASPGERAGRVGLLTSNSFMKREFGRNLVERFFPTVEISHVIDTSGAYLPGHGTPTVVLAGRNRVPDPTVPVHVVVNLRGEPGMPAVPAEGLVWKALRASATATGVQGTWSESFLQDRGQLSVFPWVLTPSAASEAMRRMEESGQHLKDRVARVGYAANTGSDDVFCASADTFRRFRAEEEATVSVLTGSEVRDWSTDPALLAFFPRSEPDREPVDLRRFTGHYRRLWPYRTALRARPGAKKTAPWYDWHQIASGKGLHRWSIVFPWVATHPHFSLLRGCALPLNSAPEIKLPQDASEESYFELLGVLNSSAVSFWLKQMSQSKGQPRTDQLRGGEAWEKIYEFTSTRLLDLPLPRTLSVGRAEQLDRLAEESRSVLEGIADPDAGLTAEFLAEAGSRWRILRSRMIAAQEELDWEMYARYGLVADDGELTSLADVPDISLGERSFEIVLAGRVAAGETVTTWFARHSSVPDTEIPDRWPSEYRSLVERRVRAIQENTLLALLEQPEHKRRWATRPWEELIHDILRDRLLRLCESSWLWYETSSQHRRPVTRSVRRLAELLEADEEFVRLAELHSPGSTATELLVELLADEHVPQAGPLRYRASGLAKRLRWEELWREQRLDDKQGIADTEASHAVPPRYVPTDFLRLSYWRQRGKFDVPNERFVSLPSVTGPLSPTTVIGWAGWSARERATAVVDLLETEPSHRPESALPLLSALAELLPQLTEPESGADDRAEDAAYLLRAFSSCAARLGLSEQDVYEWRPPAPRRGRPRRTA